MYLCLYPFLNRHTNAEYTDWRRYKYTDIQWCRTIYSCRLQSMQCYSGLCWVWVCKCEDLRVAPAWWPSCHTSSTTARWPGDVTRCEEADAQWRRFSVAKSRVAGFIGVSPGVFLPKALPGATKRSRRQVADCDSVTGESLCLLKSMTSWQVLEQILKDTKKERNDMKWYEMIRQILRNATRKWNEKSKLQLKSQRWPRRDWQVIICNNVDDVLMMSAGARSYPRYTCLIHLFPPERLQEWHECSHHCTWLSCRNRQTDAEKTSNSNQ